MNLKTICDHTINPDLLTEGGWVLDLGCGKDLNFLMAMNDLGMQVVACDPNPELIMPPMSMFPLKKCAVVATRLHTERPTLTLKMYSDIDASSIIVNSDHDIMSSTYEVEVPTTTISNIMEEYEVEQWDVIKMDVEGAEYEMLMELSGPLAKQITVEFHDFRNMNPCWPNNEDYYNALFMHLGQWYDIVQHEKTPHRGWQPPKINYWDSLFVLKG